MRAWRRCWPPVLAAGLLVFALSSPCRAAEDQAANKKISELVKTIINRGADINNLYGDPRGCYRFYQGSLITLRVLLEGQPALQKVVDTGLADAERAPAPYQRALALNQTLHKIYDHYHPRPKEAADKSPRDKPPADKAPPRDVVPPRDKAPADKPPAEKDKPADKTATDKKVKPAPKDAAKDKPAADKREVDKTDQTIVKGKITLKGKPLSAGEIALISSSEQVYTAQINADGSYLVKGLEPGDYKVTLENTKPEVPKNYSDSEKTPLKATLKKGENNLNLEAG